MLDSWKKDHSSASSLDHGTSFVAFSCQTSSSDAPPPSACPRPAPSQSRSSASSAVISPGDAASSQEAHASSESSGQSGSVLKEHDYIGLAEVSSASVMKQAAGSAARAEDATSGDLNLEETDLRLGLGPVKESPVPVKVASRTQDIRSSLELKKGELVEAADADSRKGVIWPERPHVLRGTHEVLKPEWSIADSQRQAAADPQQRNGGQDARYAFVDGAPEQRSLQNVWSVRATEGTRAATREFSVPPIPIQGQDFEAPRPAVLNSLAGAVMVPVAKNGIKRVYSEAMAEVARFNAGENRTGVNGGTGVAMVIKNAMQLQETEVKGMPKHQQGAFLASWKAGVASGWHVGMEQAGGTYVGGMTSSKGGARAEKPGDGAVWEARSKPQDHAITKDAPRHAVVDNNQESASNEAPPSKGQVVGWPPIRSYRKNTLAAHPKPTGDDGDGQSAIFVKVNMDGIPIGRKVDLNAHTCYEGLLLALEEMFQRAQGAPQTVTARDTIPNDIKQLRLLNSSEFVLTYEDKEGDWMLVGDVPWGMFVNTVRRLRIMRGSEATGLSPRGPGKPKCHI